MDESVLVRDRRIHDRCSQERARALAGDGQHASRFVRAACMQLAQSHPRAEANGGQTDLWIQGATRGQPDLPNPAETKPRQGKHKPA
jgi:hypothetical protein